MAPAPRTSRLDQFANRLTYSPFHVTLTPRPSTPMHPRIRAAAQHAVGFAIGLAIAAVAIDYGRTDAPRTAPFTLAPVPVQD